MSKSFIDEYFPCARDIWVREFHKKPNDRVWHYTGADGLLGILKSNRMWATNIKYLNDASEFKHGRTLVDEMLTKKGKDSPDLDPLLKTVVNIIEQFKTNSEVYIVCFCEGNGADDLLSQWRAYGANGGGYSIGFHRGGLDLS